MSEYVRRIIHLWYPWYRRYLSMLMIQWTYVLVRNLHHPHRLHRLHDQCFLLTYAGRQLLRLFFCHVYAVWLPEGAWLQVHAAWQFFYLLDACCWQLQQDGGQQLLDLGCRLLLQRFGSRRLHAGYRLLDAFCWQLQQDGDQQLLDLGCRLLLQCVGSRRLLQPDLQLRICKNHIYSENHLYLEHCVLIYMFTYHVSVI